MVSRFRSQSEQKKILKEVKAGNIDVLVGTHRLLQKDVHFKNLGLLGSTKSSVSAYSTRNG
jgi:transcription-repair coupling factor (superfamily II helicase)